MRASLEPHRPRPTPTPLTPQSQAQRHLNDTEPWPSSHVTLWLQDKKRLVFEGTVGGDAAALGQLSEDDLKVTVRRRDRGQGTVRTGTGYRVQRTI